MKYKYNYSFLEKWMDANRGVTDKSILQAIGTSSNTSLDLWTRGECPMQLIGLLRFCNAFCVPISAFIVDEDIEVSHKLYNGIEYVHPGEDDKMLPNVGYLDNAIKRQPGTRKLRDPIDVETIKSVVPGLTTLYPSVPCQEVSSPSTIQEDKQDVNISTINRLLDIIADQQQLIKELTHQLATKQPEFMAAEDVHHT